VPSIRFLRHSAAATAYDAGVHHGPRVALSAAMRFHLSILLVGVALGLGNGCGSVSGINDGGGGTAGGTSGHGGAAGGKGGNGGAGGTGGVSCGDLATQYADAVPAAQSCDLNASRQCQQLVSSSLSPCFLNCMTYVNDPTALNAIKASWEQAGCNNVDVFCPAIECLQPTNNTCLVGDGGSGTCSPNSGGGGRQGGHGGVAGGQSGSSGSAGGGGVGAGGSVGGAGGGHAGAGGQGAKGGGGGAGTLCPSTPPMNGYACAGQDCYYEDCGGLGRTIALCHPEGTFEVQTTACTAVACSLSAVGGPSCPAGMICMQVAGGAVSDKCVSNACGTGPIGCDCLTSCVGTCSVSGNAQGIGVSCNTCPLGQLCP
jgi:hypothetical protein